MTDNTEIEGTEARSVQNADGEAAPSNLPTDTLLEEARDFDRLIGIAVWNAAKWQGSPDEVARSLVRRVKTEPVFGRALAALQSREELIDDVRDFLAAIERAGGTCDYDKREARTLLDRLTAKEGDGE